MTNTVYKEVPASELPNYIGWEIFMNFGHNDNGYVPLTDAQVQGDSVKIVLNGEYTTASVNSKFSLRAPKEAPGNKTPSEKAPAKKAPTHKAPAKKGPAKKKPARNAAVKTPAPVSNVLTPASSIIIPTAAEVRRFGKSKDEFTALRASMKRQFFDSFSMLGGWLGATDTYKRTMGAADRKFAMEPASYALTLRKGLSEPGAGDQLIMAGHEAMLSQWFRKPLNRRKIELYLHWYADRSAVKAVPEELWHQVLSSQKGDKIFLDIDVWGFPGGQTFLKNVPCLSLNSPLGGLLTYPEPAMCRYFAPIIFATKARLMTQATDRDAEFGLRAAPHELLNIMLLLARYVGSGGKGTLTSNDTAEFLFPDMFKSIGTVGHEMMSCHQSFDKSLAEAEFEAMEQFVTVMGFASLLCDLVDALTIGKENALKVIAAHPELQRIGIRIDSGDIAEQCVDLFNEMVKRGISPRTIVFEDEVRPEKIREVYQFFREKTGVEPNVLFPGAGGYWWRDVHRDTVSAAYKRTETNGHPNVKFSNSPGKESLGGNLRVYGRGDTMIIADACEVIDGELLFVKLVEHGRIIYSESFQKQAQRANATWGKYTKVELSPLVKSYRDRFNAMRDAEVAAAKARLQR